MKTALLIMAAGIGSRYGGGIKQLAQMDTQGHIIMDYSVHDAIEAGFNKIVFVIRRDIEEDFKTIIGNRMEQVCRENGVTVCYAFQSLEDLPGNFPVPPGRQKPWGTGQAVLAAKDMLQESFAVINADDYYGKEAFRRLHSFLVSGQGEGCYCMAGFTLKNTLSDNGAVTRGICQVSQDGYLTNVVETKGIVKTRDGAEANGQVLDLDAVVSMNMWGLPTAFLALLEEGFLAFLQEQAVQDPLKAEFLIPVLIGRLLQEKQVSVKVLETRDSWFGVTYQEDRAAVTESIQKLIAQGMYAEDLYSDLES